MERLPWRCQITWNSTVNLHSDCAVLSFLSSITGSSFIPSIKGTESVVHMPASMLWTWRSGSSYSQPVKREKRLLFWKRIIFYLLQYSRHFATLQTAPNGWKRTNVYSHWARAKRCPEVRWLYLRTKKPALMSPDKGNIAYWKTALVKKSLVCKSGGLRLYNSFVGSATVPQRILNLSNMPQNLLWWRHERNQVQWSP